MGALYGDEWLPQRWRAGLAEGAEGEAGLAEVEGVARGLGALQLEEA